MKVWHVDGKPSTPQHNTPAGQLFNTKQYQTTSFVGTATHHVVQFISSVVTSCIQLLDLLREIQPSSAHTPITPMMTKSTRARPSPTPNL